MALRKWWIVVLLFLSVAHGYAQSSIHLVYFSNKQNSPFSVQRPSEFLSQRSIDRRAKQGIAISSRDLPVNPAYLDSIRKTGASVLYPTRWLNGAVVQASALQWEAIQRLSVVNPQRSELLAGQLSVNTQVEAFILPSRPAPGTFTGQESYGASFNQINMLGINQMHREGFRGEGIHIALLDGGFRGANTVDAFRNLDIRGAYSFVHGRNDVYAEGDHGVRVLSALAGFRNGELVGPAHRASFYLFQTEDERNETRAEEAWWLAAAERADSLGVDIISFSLGYYEFDDSQLNYTRQQLDGRTALITRAANAAAATGMLVFKSAGNAANSSWGALTFPADADSIVVVGAVDQTGRYSSFSSIGPTADGRRKPDIAAQGQGTIVILPGGFLTGSNGTSFSTPLAAGLAAGVWQAFPQLSARQIADLLRRSGDRANSPNDSTGFGVPHFERIKNLVTSLPEQNHPEAAIHLFPNPFAQRLFIQIPEWMEGQAAQISLYDALGRQCLTQTVVLRQTLELFDSPTLEALAQGFYVLKISTPTLQSTIRLSK